MEIKLLERLNTVILVQSQFYTYKCDGTKTINVNFDDFLKIVTEMCNLSVNVSDEIQAIVFLNLLPKSYDQLNHTLKYGKNFITLEEVTASAKSKQLEQSENSKLDNASETVIYTSDRVGV